VRLFSRDLYVLIFLGLLKEAMDLARRDPKLEAVIVYAARPTGFVREVSIFTSSDNAQRKNTFI
jgi:hypothetical protein